MAILVTGRRRLYRQPYGARTHRGGEKVVVLDNLSTGFRSAVPDERAADRRRFRRRGSRDRASRQARRRGDHPFRRKNRRAGFARRSARLLFEQHRDGAHALGLRRRLRRQAFHLLLDRRGLRRTRAGAGERIRNAEADVALWPLEADGRVDARGYRESARSLVRCVALLQRRRRRSAGTNRTIDAATQRISSRWRCRPRSGGAPAWRCSAPIIRRPTDRACAITSR